MKHSLYVSETFVCVTFNSSGSGNVSLLNDQISWMNEVKLSVLYETVKVSQVRSLKWLQIKGEVPRLCQSASRLNPEPWTKRKGDEEQDEGGYLVSRGTLLPSTQLSCSGTLSGGVVCSSAGDWPATGAGLPVGGVSCRVEFRDWPAWWEEPRDWLRAVMDGCWRWGGGTGGRVEPWWLDSCSVEIRREVWLEGLFSCRFITLSELAYFWLTPTWGCLACWHPTRWEKGASWWRLWEKQNLVIKDCLNNSERSQIRREGADPFLVSSDPNLTTDCKIKTSASWKWGQNLSVAPSWVAAVRAINPAPHVPPDGMYAN